MYDWDKAKAYLKDCRDAYTSIGSAGNLAVLLVIAPLQDRFNAGERTEQLYNAIMAIKL